MLKDVALVRVSVIMGVYEGEGRLSRAVDSVLQQSFEDFEFIICDDASKDGSYRLLEEYAARDPRIVLLRNERNRGLAASLNRCLQSAGGELVARMDDDDVSLPGRFQVQVDASERFVDCSVIGGSAILFDEAGMYGKIVPPLSPQRADVFRSTPFVHPSVMIRREHILKVGGYTVAEYTRRLEDYDLWNKLYSAGYYGLNLGDPLIKYYKSRDSYRKASWHIRMDELRLRRLWQKEIQLPIVEYGAVIAKVVLSGMIPNGMLHAYHRHKFEENQMPTG